VPSPRLGILLGRPTGRRGDVQAFPPRVPELLVIDSPPAAVGAARRKRVSGSETSVPVVRGMVVFARSPSFRLAGPEGTGGEESSARACGDEGQRTLVDSGIVRRPTLGRRGIGRNDVGIPPRPRSAPVCGMREGRREVVDARRGGYSA